MSVAGNGHTFSELGRWPSISVTCNEQRARAANMGEYQNQGPSYIILVAYASNNVVAAARKPNIEPTNLRTSCLRNHSRKVGAELSNNSKPMSAEATASPAAQCMRGLRTHRATRVPMLCNQNARIPTRSAKRGNALARWKSLLKKTLQSRKVLRRTP